MSLKLVFVCLGVLDAKNPASAHVLRKTGFHVVPELSDAETEMFGITLHEKGPIWGPIQGRLIRKLTVCFADFVGRFFVINNTIVIKQCVQFT